MYSGIVDIDEMPGVDTSVYNRKIRPEETLTKFTNPFVMKATKPKGHILQPLRIVQKLVNTSKLLQDTSMETQEVLNLVASPRMWEEGGEKWMQVVSPQPTKRCEIHTLREKLDKMLERSSGREFGICRIRIRIYEDVFNELIRQTAITCAESGIMLLRIREEMKMTRTAFKVMLEDSLNFFMKRNHPITEALSELELEKLKLLDELKELNMECQMISASYDLSQSRIAEARFTTTDRFRAEKKSRRRSCLQLKRLIFLINGPPKGISWVRPQEKRIRGPFNEDKQKKIAAKENLKAENSARKAMIKSMRINRLNKESERLKKSFEKEWASLTNQQNEANR